MLSCRPPGGRPILGIGHLRLLTGALFGQRPNGQLGHLGRGAFSDVGSGWKRTGYPPSTPCPTISP
jgi:hypothetical protein